jgi:ribonucleotide reductase beta subunit family protein with ferritin-like domain
LPSHPAPQGKRKGACCVYLEPWHADVEEFLQLRENTGDEQSRSHNLNLANQIVRGEDPSLFDVDTAAQVHQMMDEAVACETQFAEDLLSLGVAGSSVGDSRQYLEFIADQRLAALGLSPRYGARNPFRFMDLQDVQEVVNFFERRVSAYQVGVSGELALDAAF